MENEWSPMLVCYPYQLTVKVCVMFQSYFMFFHMTPEDYMF